MIQTDCGNKMTEVLTKFYYQNKKRHLKVSFIISINYFF